jgi:hypothetical protein
MQNREILFSRKPHNPRRIAHFLSSQNRKDLENALFNLWNNPPPTRKTPRQSLFVECSKQMTQQRRPKAKDQRPKHAILKIYPRKTNSLNCYRYLVYPCLLTGHFPFPPEKSPTKKPNIPREKGMPLSSPLKKMQYSSSSQGGKSPQHSKNPAKHATKITPRNHGIKH